MTALPPPPVPQGLREMLKDYPGHIDRLQEVLNRILEKKMSGADPFERAIWLLEGRLETFIAEAREELKFSEASGDATAIADAEKKLAIMFRSRSPNGGMKGLNDLLEFFEESKRSIR